MKKNALIIAYNSLNNSGVPNVIFQTIKAMSDKFNFDIITFEDDNSYYETKLKEENINVTIIPFIKSYKNKIYRHYWNYFGKFYYWKKAIKKLLKKKKYSLIHSFKEFDSFPFFIEAKRAGISKRILHSNVDHKYRQRHFLDFLSRSRKEKTLKYSTNRIAVSSQCGFNAFGTNDYILIHNPYNENAYNFSPKKPNVFTLAQVGTFSSNKNQLFTIGVFKHLKKLLPNAQLVFIGFEKENNYLAKMKNEIKKLNLEQSIKIIDGSQLTEIAYNEYSALILPSHHEGAPIVAIEAQACGLKVYCSDNITNDIDLGNVTYISLTDSAKLWATIILKNANTIKIKNDMSEFSFQNFKTSIELVYE